MSETAVSADEVRHRLYEIMKGEEPFEQKAQEALTLGTTYLDVESGFLTRIDADTDHWETIISTDNDDGLVPSGIKTDLSGTYCRHTLERESPLAIHDATDQGFGDDIASEQFHCYHGTTLTVGGEPFGTVCFVAREPRDTPFSEAETMFAELVGRLLEHELEHQRQQEELARQTSLVNVLDRVLRHNIRNKMTVIRANAKLHSDHHDGCTECQKIVDSADDLIRMTETARQLGKILNTDGEPQPVDLVELSEETLREAQKAYPELSARIEAPDELVVRVFPSLERALWELVENAAEYAGPDPAVVVRITRSGDAVEIEVGDNGPGLPDPERDVLQTGTETQLVHGSGLGLWAVYWIATAHHGDVEIDTTDGTAVTLSIPDKQTDTLETEPRIQRAGDRYQAVFEHATTGLVVLDDDGYLVEVNERATALFDRPSTELCGQHLSTFTADGRGLFTADGRGLFTADGRGLADLAEETSGTITLDGKECSYSLQRDIVPNQHLLVLEAKQRS